MRKDNLKETILALSAEEMCAAGILESAKTGYVCPECRNGTGEDATGIDATYEDGVTKYHCFKCGKSFNNLTIAKRHFHLEADSDFPRLLEVMADTFGFEKPEHGVSAPKKTLPPEQGKYSALLEYAQGNLDELCADTWRGLKREVLEYFHVGFLRADMRWKVPKISAPKSAIQQHFSKRTPEFDVVLESRSENFLPYAVIPTGSDHFLARLTAPVDSIPAELQSNKSLVKPHRGEKDIFNLASLFDPKNADCVTFAVEGEIDAISIWQVGFNAIAICGSNISKKQKSMLEAVPRKGKIIVMFDDDETGKRNSEKAVSVLEELGFTAVRTQLNLVTADNSTGEVILRSFKDANEALQFNAEFLKERLQARVIALTPELKEREERKRKLHALKVTNRTTCQCVKDAPMDVAIPAGFGMNEQGVYRIKSNGDADKITGTPVFVSKIYDVHGYSDRRVELAIRDNFKGVWHYQEFKLSDLVDPRKILKLTDYGVAITARRGTYLAQYLIDMCDLADNLSLIPRCYFYDCPGWREVGGVMKFIYPGKEGTEDFVAQGGFDYESAYCAKGDRDAWLELFGEVINASPTARIAIGAALSAVLIAPLGLRNSQLHLCAKSGSGKTALAKFAMSIFGNPLELRNTFDTTANALDQLSYIHNDFPLWVDELQSAPRRLVENLDSCVYTYENGRSKQRMTKEITQRKVMKFRGTRITTGEMPISRMASSLGVKARVVELDMPKVLPDELARKIHRTFSTNSAQTFGHFGRDFIQYVANHTEEVQDTFNKMRTLCSNWAEGFYSSHIDSFGAWYTAEMIFMKMLGMEQRISSQILARDFAAYIQHNNHSRISTNGQRGWKMLLESVSTYRQRYTTWIEATQEYKLAEREPKLGAVLRDGSIAFYPHAVSQFLEDQGFPSGLAVLTDMHNEGMFDESDSKAHPMKKAVRIEGRVDWMYVVKPEFCKEKATCWETEELDE